MHGQHAFVDEFGNTGLDFTKQDVSTHYIVSAIIVDDAAIPTLETKLDAVRRRHFQTGEMKSSTVGTNDSRRIRILKDLIEIDFHIFAVVADKRLIYGEGLTYKESFLKFMHSLVDRILFRTFQNLKMSSDEHGSGEFMQGFVRHVREHHIPDLFDQSDFQFVPSQSTLFVQLADFIAGTLARTFDETKKSPKGAEFLKLLQPKIVGLHEWPRTIEPYQHEQKNRRVSEEDTIIKEQAVNLALQYIEKNEGRIKPAIGDQIKFLRTLLFQLRHIDPDRYVGSLTIANNLNVGRALPITEHYLRTKVVAALRDQGLLIASSPLGYKLPTCVKDLYDFVNHGSGMIRPMLNRIESCRRQIRLATKNKIDILNQPAYSYLRNFFDVSTTNTESTP